MTNRNIVIVMHGMVSRNVAEGNIDKECMTMGERARERERERERERNEA